MAARQYSDAPVCDFDSMPEMRGYTAEPEGMYVGCPGKHGYLKLGFEKNREGKTILRDLDRRAPLIVQKELYFDEQLPEMPCVYILSSGGPNVDGDRYVQKFHLKKDAMAFISTGAATKLAEMKSNYSGMRQTIVLEAGSYLEYLPEPVIPCKHTRYISDTAIVADPTASMFYSEIYMPGRKYYKTGEIFEYDVLSVCVHGSRPDGMPLFREKFVITPQDGHIRDIGIMSHYDVFANVVGLAPENVINEIYTRTEPGIDRESRLAYGITHLPNHSGLLFRALGMEPGPVKKIVRSFCSDVRMAVKGCPLPDEFPWR